jgi:hypothetical protein
MKIQKIFLLCSVTLLIAGCGKEATVADKGDKKEKVEVVAKTPNKDISSKNKTEDKEVAVKTPTSSEEPKKEEAKPDKTKSTESAKAEAPKSETKPVTQSKTETKTTSPVTQPKTETKKTTPVTQPTTPVTNPTAPVTNPPVTAPVTSPTQSLPKLTVDMLDSYASRSSIYSAVKASQLNDLRGNVSSYASTSLTNVALLLTSSGRLSQSELSKEFVGKTDGKYKVTGVYINTVTIPFLSESYTIEELNSGRHFYEKAKEKGLYATTYKGIIYDQVRGVINQGNLAEGMKITRLVITFEEV